LIGETVKLTHNPVSFFLIQTSLLFQAIITDHAVNKTRLPAELILLHYTSISTRLASSNNFIFEVASLKYHLIAEMF
jgi:hypothetical protein